MTTGQLALPGVTRGLDSELAERPAATAANVAAWIEGQVVTQGPRRGERYELLAWEREPIEALLRPGSDPIVTAAVTIARGNGKSTWAGLLGGCAVAPDGPLMVPGSEAVIVASSLSQARISFRSARDALARWTEPELERGPRARRWRLNDSSTAAEVRDTLTGAALRCIGSDPKRAHGLQPHLLILDEPAAWPAQTRDEMFEILLTAAGKNERCLILAVGTMPSDPDHWFRKMLAPGGADWSRTYAARETDPPGHRRTWLRANPALPEMPHLEAVIRAEYRRAKRDPALLETFKWSRLNLGGGDSAAHHLWPLAELRRAEADKPAEGPTVWGIDAASTGMGAIACLWPVTGRLDAIGGVSRIPDLEERGRRAGAGRTYLDAYERGELVVAGERTLDLRSLVGVALAKFGPPTAIALDRWRRSELLDELAAAGMPAAHVHSRGQGYRDNGEDVRAFKRLALDGDIRPVPNKIVRDGFRWAVTMRDPAGNEKLRRVGQTHYDDVASAAVMAAGVAAREPRLVRPSQRGET